MCENVFKILEFENRVNYYLTGRLVDTQNYRVLKLKVTMKIDLTLNKW